MGIRLAAWKELLRRYLAITREIWKQRHLLSTGERTGVEVEFLPAALELEEKPPSPAPRVAMWLLAGLTLVAAGWACLGQLDVVVTAEGRIVPSDGSKVIQPAQTAVVKAIYVKDGQQVRAGDLLLELDATIPAADEKSARGDWEKARLTSARAIVYLRALRGSGQGVAGLKDRETSELLEGIAGEKIVAEERILTAQIEEYQAHVEQLDAEIARHEAELKSGQEALNRLRETLPIARGRAEDYQRLYEQDYVSKHDWEDRERERITLEYESKAQASKIAEMESALLARKREKERFSAESRRAAREALAENEVRSLSSSQEQIKAAQHVALYQLRAPVPGQVQQLAVHTVGGVVTPAQPLMVIVPGEDSLEIEASIQNKDIGFVREGQSAVVKIEAFPYTKYGTIPGDVKHLSMDAVTDEKKGLIYASRVTLSRSTIRAEARDVPLSPGMAVAVEIKTGKRRVIEYLLSPLLKQANESFRER